ncbi:MAG: sodium/solute symporter [Gemmatimonadota bacterium]|nr:MAG: sodium/solute symporter [Gemmatimonadota bacterium]
MNFSALDTCAFVGYFLIVAFVAGVAGRREREAADYFLAGRNLPWWVIGVSLIASSLSTEHFVGMAGSSVDFGLAIASYEWMAAITLVVVARWFLPKFLSMGITTMPQYLEERFDVRSRGFLAFYMILAYVFVAMATVLFGGGLALQTIFGLPLGWGITMLAVFAGAYTAYGGLKAVVWTDLVQGAMLVLGGAITTVVGLRAVGGWDVLRHRAGEKFHTVLPLDHPELPWFGVFFGGLWVANLFYWGCNQFITQRTLAAKDVRQGLYGAVFAAYIKLIIPFIIVIPGIIAWTLYSEELTRSDMAYPLLIQRLLPSGLTGLICAALLAAIMSSLDSMLNSSATIFTVDIYQRHLRPAASQAKLIAVGRLSTVIFLVVAAAWAPVLLNFERVFSYIQEFWGLVTPGVAVVFLGGLFWRRATARAAAWVMALTLPATVGVKLLTPGATFLDQMWLAGLALIFFMVLISRLSPEPERELAMTESAREISTTALLGRDWLFDILCLGVAVLTVALFVVFF